MKIRHFAVLLIIATIAVANIYVVTKEETVTTNYNKITEKKRVALTFDDGPGGVYTKKLLKGLKKRNVKATFFLVGKLIENNEKLVKKIYKQGHLIGNHTYNHVDLSKLDFAKGYKEIHKTNAYIKRLTGYTPKYIRPPFGEWNKRVMRESNMSIVLWNVDPRDWKDQNTNLVVKRVLSNVEDGDIILLHDIFKTSVDAALIIIDRLQEKGYEFVRIDQLNNGKIISP